MRPATPMRFTRTILDAKWPADNQETKSMPYPGPPTGKATGAGLKFPYDLAMKFPQAARTGTTPSLIPVLLSGRWRAPIFSTNQN